MPEKYLFKTKRDAQEVQSQFKEKGYTAELHHSSPVMQRKGYRHVLRVSRPKRKSHRLLGGY